VTVEPYSEKYLPDLVRLTENFHKEAVGAYDNIFDANTLTRTIQANRESDGAFLLVVNGKCEGLLFGVVTKSLINDNLIFNEIIWYVNEPFRRYGVTLLREVKNILKSRGVSIMIMAVLENSKTEKIKRFYESLGGKIMETHYSWSL